MHTPKPSRHASGKSHPRRLSPIPSFQTVQADLPSTYSGEPRSPHDTGTPPLQGRGGRHLAGGGGGTPSSKGGPKTPAGKAASSRNATSHGLFAKHAVLPHLGEDPAQYESLLKHLFDQVRPRNLLERQYLELWAEASWKLRRLSRLEADLWEDDTLTRVELLSQLEKLDRMQSSLRRRMDKAVHMLGPDLPRLFAARTREDLMDHLGLTPSLCAGHPYRERDLEEAVRDHRTYPDPSLTDPMLTDAVPADTPLPAEATPDTENCENGPPVPAPAPTVGAHRDAPNPARNAPNPADNATHENKKCENGLPSSALPTSEAAEPTATSLSPLLRGKGAEGG